MNYFTMDNGMCTRDFPGGRISIHPPPDGVSTVLEFRIESFGKWIYIDEKERLICDSTPSNRFCGVAYVYKLVF